MLFKQNKNVSLTYKKVVSKSVLGATRIHMLPGKHRKFSLEKQAKSRRASGRRVSPSTTLDHLSASEVKRAFKSSTTNRISYVGNFLCGSRSDLCHQEICISGRELFENNKEKSKNQFICVLKCHTLFGYTKVKRAPLGDPFGTMYRFTKVSNVFRNHSF